MCKGKILSQEDQGGKNSLKINHKKFDYLSWISYQESKKGVYEGKNSFEEECHNTASTITNVIQALEAHLHFCRMQNI